MFGVAGEDGTGTGHEFEDGRAERVCGTSASSTWVEADWNIDNDSGGGDGNQYAPEGFDPGVWANDGDSCLSPTELCDDSCTWANDGVCDDGSPGT